MIFWKATASAAALLLASAGFAAAFPATATTSLNVRSGPGTNYGVVDQLQPGETVEVVAESGSWSQLADGGWASSNYLSGGGSAVVDPGYDYAYADYGSPAFYYGSDPFFWDDGGYYWYWNAGRRHRIDHDWWRRHRRDIRWDRRWNRRDWDRDRPRQVRRDDDRDDSRRVIRRRGDDGPNVRRRVDRSDLVRRDGGDTIRRREGRASAGSGPRRVEGGGGPRRIEGGGGGSRFRSGGGGGGGGAVFRPSNGSIGGRGGHR